jgi:hypothetical protein
MEGPEEKDGTTKRERNHDSNAHKCFSHIFNLSYRDNSVLLLNKIQYR